MMSLKWHACTLQSESNLHRTSPACVCAYAGGASGLEQSVGRLVGALCVVSGKDDDAESAMLASWVSQVTMEVAACPECCSAAVCHVGMDVQHAKHVTSNVAAGNAAQCAPAMKAF